MVKRKGLNREAFLAARKFISHLETKGIPVQKAIVFGSWAKGNQTSDSDIDLCLVSQKFGKDEVADLQFLLKQTREVDDRIEPLPLSLEDFQASATPLVAEIKKYGRIIKV